MREAKKINRPLLYLIGGLVLGETMALWIAASGVLWGLVPALMFLLFLGRKRCAGPAFLCLVLAAAGWLTGGVCMTWKTAALLNTEAAALELSAAVRKESVVLEGTVAGLETASSGERLVLKNCHINWKEESRKLSAAVLCHMDPGQAADIGQNIAVSGRIEPIRPPGNPGEYDARMSSFSKGIGCRFYGEKLSVTGGRTHRLMKGLLGVRKMLENAIDRVADPKDAGIFKAVLLGNRTEMDTQVYELYRRNGIAHLISISGLHVSLIGMGLWKLFRKAGLGRGASGLAAGGVLAAYGLMIGFSPSVGRAVFMLLLSFLADYLGRTYDLVSALCAAAACLLILEPYLLTQMGFQLSFLAVAGIAFLGRPLIENLRLPGRLSGIEPVFHAFLISLSVQLATVPVILYHSYEIPVYGIFLNLVVIPPMAVVLYSGLAALALSHVWKEAAVFVLGGGHFILLFYEALCYGAQKLPGAVWRGGRPENWQVALYYGMILSGLGILRMEGGIWRQRAVKALAAAGVWGISVFVLMPIPESGLSVTFLDVGQGDGIFLETAYGNLLVDCGSSQNRSLGEYSLVPFLKSRGVAKLDTAVITHGDSDHVSGIRYILEHPECGIGIHRLIMPQAGRGEEIYEELEALAKRAGTVTDYIGRGTVLPVLGGSHRDSGPVRVACLYPSADTIYKNRNDHSLVLLVEYGRFRMLLTGDLEDAGERELMGRGGPGPVTVLKVGHHGSAGSSGDEFIKMLSPSAAVLSYGEGNRYGHPAERVTTLLADTGSEVWETAKSGAVMVWTDGDKMKIKGFRTGR